MLIVKPLEAILPENFKSTNRTEPYCLVTLGDYQIKGRPCKNGGTTPTWRDNIVFQYKREFLCCVQVKDRYVLTNDGLIGTCAIDLEYLKEEKRSSRWFNLYYRKNVVGQILIELIYPATSQELRFINPKAQDITKQSKEQIRLLERNMNKHLWNEDDIMIISDDDINPIPTNTQTVPLQERDSNVQQENPEFKQLQKEATLKFCDSTASEICPRETMKSVQISHLGTTPSKSQQMAKEYTEKEKRPRKRERSIGRKIIDSIKNFFTSRRKHSVQVEPVIKESLQRTGTKESNISPIKMAKQESDQSSISTIKSIVFDQKNDQKMRNIQTEPALVLSEVLDKEERSLNQNKANFSVNSLILEEKENSSGIANRMTTTESAYFQTRDSVIRMKSQSNSARNNLQDAGKENKENKKNDDDDEVGWLEMAKRGVIIIEDLSNNEKRILEIKPTRMSLERESNQSTISLKRGVGNRKLNTDESLSRYRRLYR